MSKLQSLSVFVSERLMVAAVEIFDVVEKMVEGYKEEISRSKQENYRLQRLLRITPEIKLRKINSLQFSLAVSDEEVTPEQQHCAHDWSPSLGQEGTAPTQIKEEQKEIRTSHEVWQQKEQQADIIEFIFAPPCVNSECDIPQTQTVEDRGSDSKLLDLKPLRKCKKISTTSKKPHCCLDCGKCFTQVGRLKMHSRIHSEAKPFSCGDCGNRFHLKGELTKHILIHTEDKLFNCGDCGKNFNHKVGLNRHILLVHKERKQNENGKMKGEKPFCCGDCGKSFTRRQTLNRHKMIHTGEKPFHCGFCGKGFNRKETLIDHIQNHTGEKPFSCGDCGKSFNRKRNLTSHLLTHTEEKPFTCGDCGKSFKQKSDLTKHIMIHMEEKPFKCGECGKSFNYKVNLNRHMLFIHKERKQEDSGKKKDN
ncbi:gastrula zinc finger protein XlCGF57.1-like [Oncorhynchus clarkii lewisi]|uniref:gastrula zinc finger protein XlCGF57.1-like n=1 Tax=Oncorhynchus clarkii lewisi TaxID=490388 RepID=UPI0039B8207E